MMLLLNAPCQVHLLKVKLNIRMEKKADLRDFECNILVCTRWADLSIATLSRFYGEWCEKMGNKMSEDFC